MVCPPLLEGDYWIEEAVRIHAESLARHLKAKSANEGKDLEELSCAPITDSCPAQQIARLLLDRIMAHKSAAPFRKPVNAAAMKLKDYHKIVTKPMDLGTIYSRCVHGEYMYLGDLVEDVELVFSNAKKFNPEGNFVHTMAVEMESLFFKELDLLTSKWKSGGPEEEGKSSWKSFLKTSMSLDMTLELLSAGEVNDAKDSEVAVVASSDCTSSASSDTVTNEPPSNEDLLCGGPNVLSQRMAGDDKWMIEKKPQPPAKRASISKKGNGKRRRSSSTSVSPVTEEEPSPKRRRQTWLGEEVGASVRSMRTSFFACSLVPAVSMSDLENEKAETYSDYIKCYKNPQGSSPASKVIASEIADARSSLLEFSQRRHLEFDTLRHAKYSTAVILYYLHNQDTPGVIPICTSCNQEAIDCRWHKIVKVEELRKAPCKRKRPGKTAAATEKDDDKTRYQPEELCSACHAKHSQKDQFIPLPVSFKSD